MKQPNYKSGYLVENKITGELHLVTGCTERGITVIIYGFNFKKDNHIWYSTILAKDYKKISSKSVKFNLSKTNKSK